MKSEVTDEMSLQELRGVIDNLMRYHSGALAKYACRAIDAALRLEAEMEDRVEDARSEGHQKGWDEGYEQGFSEGEDDGHKEGFRDGQEDAASEDLDEALEFVNQLYDERVAAHGSCGDALLTSFLRRHGRNV